MPQLDFSYYLSQITWLLVSFGLFFGISKIVILPKLNKVLQNRANLISNNTNFAKQQLEKAKNIQNELDKKLLEEQEKFDNVIADLVKTIKQTNNDKIEKLKKELILDENKNIVNIQNELKSTQNAINTQIIEIVSSLFEKIYSVKIDKIKIQEFYNKYI